MNVTRGDLRLFALAAVATVFAAVTRYVDLGDVTAFVVSGICIALLYLVARVYNILEVFFSLRATPPALYQTVQWPNWLPHF